MNAEEWRQVDRIFSEALDLEGGERARFIEEACAGNLSLRREVESLIESHSGAGSFLESGAAEQISSRRVSIAAGTHFGPYRILANIGAGGMGEVYKAHDSRLRRDVAVKVLQRVVSDGATWERFVREARSASALNHPNICTVYDVGEADGQPYLVMELLEGVTLSEHLSEQPLETDMVLTIAVQIAEALEAAHAKGIVHRDIKPANVMISSRGRVKVLDFGLAKQTAIAENPDESTRYAVSIVGTVIGTPAYVSPEVLQGAPADARSDLWALGVLLYQMLSGRLPFAGATLFEMSSAILKEPPPPLPASVPAELHAIVERCLAKRPEQRYQNVGEVRSELEALHTHATLSSGITRRTWMLAASAAAVSAIGLLWWLKRPEPAPIKLLSTGGPPSKNQEANRLFDQAMDLERKESNIPEAQAKLAEAIALDPDFYEARCRYAFEYVLLLLNGFSSERRILDDAKKELEKLNRDAYDLASLPAAFTALYMAQGRKDLIPTRDLNRLIEQRPDVTTNKLWRMIMNVYVEEDEVAKQEAGELLSREPNLAPARLYLGDLLRREGHIEEAIDEHKKVLKRSDHNVLAFRYLALAYMDQEDMDQARKQLDMGRSSAPNNFVLNLTSALLLAVEGKHAMARQAMNNETEAFASATFTVTSELAEFYAQLGDSTNAILWLGRAVANGDERSKWFLRNPRLDRIKKDDRFVTIIRNIESSKARRKLK